MQTGIFKYHSLKFQLNHDFYFLINLFYEKNLMKNIVLYLMTKQSDIIPILYRYYIIYICIYEFYIAFNFFLILYMYYICTQNEHILHLKFANICFKQKRILLNI